MLLFTDASKIDDVGQLGVVEGILIGGLKKDNVYHILSWLSHKRKRPVISVPAAEILAVAEGIDEGKMLAQAYSELFDIDINLQLCVDSKDLLSSLCTQRNAIDRSISGDVSCIWFEFQTGAIHKITWIPGEVNLADQLPKKDSVLSEAMQLAMFIGRLILKLEDISETKSFKNNLVRKER